MHLVKVWDNYGEQEVFQERMQIDKDTKIAEHSVVEEQIVAGGMFQQ